MKVRGIELFLFVSLVALYASNFLVYDLSVPVISNEGYVIADVEAYENNNTIKLISGCKEISVEVDQHQALSIYYGLQDENYERPLTHDLVRDISEEFGLNLLHARIDSAKSITTESGEYAKPFAGKLYFNKDNKLLELDARMTDTIGIAYRMEIPLHIRSDIIDSLGTDRC